MGKSLPKSLPDFQRIFPNEEACYTYLYAARFSNGFICPYCDWPGNAYRFQNRPDMLHKLRTAMVRPGHDAIGGVWSVEVDETYVSGATQGEEGEGSEKHHKTLVGGIVEVRPRKKAPGPDTQIKQTLNIDAVMNALNRNGWEVMGQKGNHLRLQWMRGISVHLITQPF